MFSDWKRCWCFSDYKYSDSPSGVLAGWKQNYCLQRSFGNNRDCNNNSRYYTGYNRNYNNNCGRNQNARMRTSRSDRSTDYGYGFSSAGNGLPGSPPHTGNAGHLLFLYEHTHPADG